MGVNYGMKKYFWLVSLVLVLFLIAGCVPKVEEEAPYEATLDLRVVGFSSGSRVEDADIKVVDPEGKVLLTSKSSSESDSTLLKVPLYHETEFVDVLVTKEGHGASKLVDLKLEDGEKIEEEIVLKTAELNSDPSVEEFPEVEIEFMTPEGTPINIDEEVIKGDFVVSVKINKTKWESQFVYSPLFNRIPRAGVLTPERAIVYEDEAEFNVDINAADNGLNKLYLVLYDENGNRLQYVFYINVLKPEKEIEIDQMYDAIPMIEEEIPNIFSFTRRRGVEFYGGVPTPNFEGKNLSFDQEIDLEQNISKELEGIREPYSAPKDANLFVQLYWFDYDSSAYFGLVEEGQLRPDGYNVYRSFDGENYKKIGYMSSDFVMYNAYYNYYYLHLGYPMSSLFPLFVDGSAELEAGKETWYGVTSVYGDKESDMVDLGSVVPLDKFNVVLEEPLDGSVDVSRAPTFKWSPDNTLTSTEGTVTYNYNIFIYDRTQADNGLIVPFSDVGSELSGFTFSDTSASQIIAPFTGYNTEENWGYTWYYFNEYGLTVIPYDYEVLQPNKTYGWGVNVAYADVLDEDSWSLSIAADFRLRDTSWGIDPYPYGMEPDLHADFTTGH
jgi:hypothetical protein